MTQHASDCAVHNAPAIEPGHCDCGATQGREALYAARGALKTEHTYDETDPLQEAAPQQIPDDGGIAKEDRLGRLAMERAMEQQVRYAAAHQQAGAGLGYAYGGIAGAPVFQHSIEVQRRMLVLGAAERICGPNGWEQVLEAALCFEAFLIGEKSEA